MGLRQIGAMVAAVVLSYFLGPEMLEAFDGLIGPIAFFAINPTMALLAADAVSQLIANGSLNVGSAFEDAAVSGLTAGLAQRLPGSTGLTNG